MQVNAYRYGGNSDSDLLHLCVQEYGILSGDEMSDYLLYTMKEISDITGKSTSDLMEGADKSMVGKKTNEVMSQAELQKKERQRTRQAASLSSGFKKKAKTKRGKSDPDVDRFNWNDPTGKPESKSNDVRGGTMGMANKTENGEEGRMDSMVNPNTGMYDANGRPTGLQSVSG